MFGQARFNGEAPEQVIGHDLARPRPVVVLADFVRLVEPRFQLRQNVRRVLSLDFGIG